MFICGLDETKHARDRRDDVPMNELVQHRVTLSASQNGGTLLEDQELQSVDAWAPKQMPNTAAHALAGEIECEGDARGNDLNGTCTNAVAPTRGRQIQTGTVDSVLALVICSLLGVVCRPVYIASLLYSTTRKPLAQ